MVQYIALVSIDVGDDDSASLNKRLNAIFKRNVHYGQVHQTVRQLVTMGLVEYGPGRARKTCKARSYVLTAEGRGVMDELDGWLDRAYNLPRMRLDEPERIDVAAIDLKDLLDFFGGVTKTAWTLGIGELDLHRWKARKDRQIPKHRRKDVTQRAIEKGYPVGKLKK